MAEGFRLASSRVTDPRCWYRSRRRGGQCDLATGPDKGRAASRHAGRALWYEEKESLRGGGIQVYTGDMRVGVGDRVQPNGDSKRPETKEDGFDYGQYLQARGISG